MEIRLPQTLPLFQKSCVNMCYDDYMRRNMLILESLHLFVLNVNQPAFLKETVRGLFCLEMSQPMELAMPGVFGRRAQVKIRGTSLDGTAKYFTIQLTTTEGIALQMLIPTFGEIAMNSTQAGMWELEERYPNRIHVGHSFEIKIKNQGDYMEVKINGHHLASFFHRELPSKIKGLFVRGDISLKDVRFKNFKGSREGPAVMLHTNLPPQQAPLYIQRQSIALPIEVAASHQVYTEGPPPYPQDEFPLHSSPQKF